MATTTALNTFGSNFSADASTYIAKKLLMLALKQMALYQLCDMDQLPKNNSRTLQYTRYERVDLPQQTLSEGVTPDFHSMSISTVTAVMDQWGAVIPVTDVAIDSVKHPVLQQAIGLAANQAAETIDREVAKVMLTGTNIYYPGAVVSRATLGAGSKITSTEIAKVVANLRADGANPREDGYYVGVLDPFSEEDVIEDIRFIESHRYGQIKKLMEHEIGAWKGVRWVRSNTLPYVTRLDDPAEIHQATADAGGGTGQLGPAAYFFKVAVVDRATGHETYMEAEFSESVAAPNSAIDITLGALPANATSGSLFRIYAGTVSGGPLYLVSSDHAPAAVVRVTQIPSSGDVAQATPPGGDLTVRHAWVIGKQAVICASLNNIRATLTPAVASDSDPLIQRRKVGWKTDFKTVIANDDFLARLEHVTTDGNIA